MDRMRRFRFLSAWIILCTTGLCAAGPAESPAAGARWGSISAARLLETIKVLASDEYEGRAPASRGEELTTAFLKTEFEKLGLKPGNPDGTFFQKSQISTMSPRA